MIKEGKEYNSDYCLAKAIMYVTITEAMNEMGLMNIDDKAYGQIISAAGGTLLEKPKQPSLTKSPFEKTTELYNKLKANQENKGNVNIIGVATPTKNGKEVNLGTLKPAYLEEHILINQYNDPINNNGGNDFGERIRQRKLMKEQQIINE